MEINVIVRNKIAKLVKPFVAVCGNSDYVINFDFDEEWEPYETKTARFKYNGIYTDVVFDGNECPMPVINDTYTVEIGAFAGDIHTSTPALLPMKKSILCGEGSPEDPTPEVYNQIMGKLNNLDPEGYKKLKEEIGNLEDLDTEAKENLVAAINEALETKPDPYIAIAEGDMWGSWSLSSGTPYADMKAAYEAGQQLRLKLTGVINIEGLNLTAIYDVDNKPEFVFALSEPTEFTISGISVQMILLRVSEGGIEFGETAQFLTRNVLTNSISDRSTDKQIPTAKAVYIADENLKKSVLSFGLTSAEAGQTIKIKTVDENGKPTSWEAAKDKKIRWAQVVDMTTTEELNIINISTDLEGRTFASYNAIGMLTVLFIPADSTQTSTSGAVWVAAQREGYNSRANINFANWKTVSRTLSQCHLGTTGGVAWCGVTNSGAMSSMNVIDNIFSCVRIVVHNTDDHLPIGTAVRVFLLSEENT